MGKKTLYYKVLCNGVAQWSGWAWPLPSMDEYGVWVPGEWTPVVEKVRTCETGYHLARPKELLEWLKGNEVYVAEAAGYVKGGRIGDNKVVCKSARLMKMVSGWNRETSLRICERYINESGYEWSSEGVSVIAAMLRALRSGESVRIRATWGVADRDERYMTRNLYESFCQSWYRWPRLVSSTMRTIHTDTGSHNDWLLDELGL